MECKTGVLDNYYVSWERNREKYIDILKNIYNTNQLSLVLGSGVSKASGLPLWPDLVKELYTDLIFENYGSKPDWDSLDLTTADLILQARYIKSGYDSSASFFKAILRALYSKNIDIKNPLINSIADLCAPTRYKLLKSVITYNFDDLLEKKLDKFNIEYKTIYDNNVVYAKSALPIYHVHGYLSSEVKDFENLNIIFSDEDYNRQSSTEIYSWSNVIQLTSFKDGGNLFIGLSFNDTNLRRILEIVKHNFRGVINYTIQKHSFDPAKHPENQKDIFYINDYLKEQVLLELGVKVIWVDEYDEIPEMLHSIKVS